MSARGRDGIGAGMHGRWKRFTAALGLALACGLTLIPDLRAATTFTVATYNLENYLLAPEGTRPAKSDAGRARIRESLRRLGADVVALQEIGPTNALLELRASLKAEGLDYPYWEHVTGWDTNIFVAVLSRFPITDRHPHSRESFLLQGRRFRVSRGFAEIDLQVGADYRFTLLAAHLKSRRASAVADEAELREQEAILLRAKVDAILQTRPRANLVVLGDFNDTRNTKPLHALMGRGGTRLVDTRPAESNGDDRPNRNPRYDPRTITWTHFYGVEDSYERVDYILLSPGMAREWDRSGTYVLAMPNWGEASDHRPIIARFIASDR